MVAMAVTGFARVSDAILTGVWTAALVIMGVACVANALKCGRVHCYFMGPFFLAFAVVTVLFGVGMLTFGDEGWSYIAMVVGAGSALLYYVPERIWGRYRGGSTSTVRWS